MQSYVSEREPTLRLAWSGDRTFYEPSGLLIALEQPPQQMEAPLAAERIALALDHELAHARFTDQDVYRQFLHDAPALVHEFAFVEWIIELFNFLEDSRLVEQVRSVEPDAAANLEKLNRLAVSEWVEDYASRNAESPWMPDPPMKRDQASVALIEQILVGARPVVHPDVEEIRNRVQPHIDTALSGSTQDVADAAANIYGIVVGTLTG